MVFSRQPSNPLTLVLASTNQGKMAEVESFMIRSGLPVRVIMPNDLEEVEETGSTFLENALLKASSARVDEGVDYILAEDSGFEIPALAGTYGLDPFPGLYSSRWMTEAIRETLLGIQDNFDTCPRDYQQINTAILKLMAKKSDQRARYVAALALQTADHQTVFTGEGAVEMTVITDGNPRGEHGFGYDPIVCPSDAERKLLNLNGTQTMAELSVEDKNRISHRGKALELLALFLKERHPTLK